MSVILTDYPKTKGIDANLRGVETKKLLDLHEQLYRTMMIAHLEEAGGYVIYYSYNKIREELTYRKVEFD